MATNKNEIQVMSVEEAEKDEQKFMKFNTEHILKGHKDWVLTMKHFENYLFTGSDDKSIKVWDLE